MNKTNSKYFEVAWPIVLETIFVSLLSSVDTMMVSQLGSVAVAAVGLTQQPRLIMLMIIMSMNVGVTTVCGRLKGAGAQLEANRCMKSATAISLMISLVCMELAQAFAVPIIRFAGANADTLNPAVSYFRYIMIGYVFHAVSLTITAAQRGIGKTKISLVTNLSANIINIFLNYLLIHGKMGFPALGVEGAALATMLSNVASMVIALVSACRPSGYLNFLRRTGMARLAELRMIYYISKGVVLERLGHRVGLLLFFKIIASIGTLEYAAYTICQRFSNLSFSIGDGLGVAAATLIAQSMGKNDAEQAQAYGKTGLKISVTASALYSMLIVLGRGPLLKLFVSEADLMAACQIGIVAVSICGLVHIPQTTLMGALRGAGDTQYLANVVLFTTMIYRPVVAWLLCVHYGFGLFGAYFAFISETVIRFVFTIKRFRSAKWAFMDSHDRNKHVKIENSGGEE